MNDDEVHRYISKHWQDKPPLSLQSLADGLGITKSRAARFVSSLESSNRLIVKKRGKYSTYVPVEVKHRNGSLLFRLRSFDSSWPLIRRKILEGFVTKNDPDIGAIKRAGDRAMIEYSNLAKNELPEEIHGELKALLQDVQIFGVRVAREIQLSVGPLHSDTQRELIEQGDELQQRTERLLSRLEQ
jgi:hypothetical protein